MPTLIKKSGSDVWFIRYRNSGQDRLKSTGETDKKEAKKQLKTAEREAQLERTVDDRMDEILLQLRNMPDVEQREQARHRLLSRLQAAADRKVTVADTWAEWRKVPRKTSEVTIAGYDAVWKRFRGWLSEHHPAYEHLAQITAADARGYSRNLWDSRITVTTYKLHLSFLCRVWRELKADAGLVENVWSDLVREKMDKETVSRKPLTRDQLTTIIKSATGELRNMYLVGLLTSLRLKDVVFLNAANFNEAENVLQVTPFKTRRKNKVVTIPVHPQLVKLLKSPGEDGLYFPEMAKRYKALPSDVSRAVQDHFESCGIETTLPIPEDCRRKRAAVIYGFHSLRYSFVSLCAKAKTPQHVLKELVGHSTPGMTMHYSVADEQQRAKAIRALPTIEV
jgi:integrase